MTRERDPETRESRAELVEADGGTHVPGKGRGVEQEIASGRPASTPFALTGFVALVVWGAAAVIVAVLFLVVWLS